MIKYNRQEFANAVKLFNDYLKEFPKGFFRDQAFFYRGESYPPGTHALSTEATTAGSLTKQVTVSGVCAGSCQLDHVLSEQRLQQGERLLYAAV